MIILRKNNFSDSLFCFFQLLLGTIIIILLLKNANNIGLLIVNKDTVIFELIKINWLNLLSKYLFTIFILFIIYIVVINKYLVADNYRKIYLINYIFLIFLIISLIICLLTSVTKEEFELILSMLSFFGVFSFLVPKNSQDK